ncbi:toll/interleukin-1 receptor domain-containing protein [Saccharothrix deserti]|uniref:toll/interleukin-1 receptor domain-containing protein n=1 Tax=Saccharothrix deserti TaxID=2593674 RepID=UPI00131D1876|nr:toll/interleukin-1 receptor domain-containing protein [Saccharothrix deserti]
MSGIFINYRHGPHSVAVAALADRLAAHFGRERVFVDHRMASGSRYPDELREHLAAADVLVAVIHTGWVDGFDRDPDWVRWEIATALDTGKEVVPLLLEDTPPPTRAELPEDIGELAMRQATRVRAAHLAEDVDRLVLRLDEWVSPSRPATPRPSPKPRRPWLRAAPWSAAVVLLPVLMALAYGNESWTYVAAAVISLVVMIWTAMSFLVELLMVKPSTRLERRTGVLPYRQFLRRSLAVFALAAGLIAIQLIDFARQGGQWRIYVALVIGVFCFYYIDRMLYRKIRHDQEWPPEPSLERHQIRRTAVRLHEALTASPGRYPSRSRLHQEQAVQVYLDLAETRLILIARRDCTWRAWLTAGHTVVPITFLAWTAGITGLMVTAAVLHAMSGSTSTRLYFAGVVMVLIAAAAAVAGIALNRLVERRTDSQVVAELTEWQQTLGPLIFVRTA